MSGIQPTLSRTEWQAVSIALADAARCGCAAPDRPNLFGRLFGTLTGHPQSRPLADPRLEAIRRFVCETRRTRMRAEALVPELEALGFTRPQVEALALLSA